MKRVRFPPPPRDPAALVQPRGCASPTTTGASFDLLPVVAQAARLAVQTLLRGEADAYPDVDADVMIMSLRTQDRALAAPNWATHRLEQHPDCPLLPCLRSTTQSGCRAHPHARALRAVAGHAVTGTQEARVAADVHVQEITGAGPLVVVAGSLAAPGRRESPWRRSTFRPSNARSRWRRQPGAAPSWSDGGTRRSALAALPPAAAASAVGGSSDPRERSPDGHPQANDATNGAPSPARR